MSFVGSEDPEEKIGETGPVEGGLKCPLLICSICHDEIRDWGPAYHANCGMGAYHQKCLSERTTKDPWCPHCRKPFPLGEVERDARILTAANSNTEYSSSTSDSSSNSDDDHFLDAHNRMWDELDRDLEKPTHELTPEPESESECGSEPGTPTLPCTFIPAEGLMDLINTGQASIQSLSGPEVRDLPMKARDKQTALRLSPALAQFIRVFYHSPSEPRDESTLYLAHPELLPGEPPSASRRHLHHHPHRRNRSSPVASPCDTPSASDRAEIDQLNDMVSEGLRSKARRRVATETAAPVAAGHFIRPPTVCGYVTLQGRRAKIVTGMVWVTPGESIGILRAGS